MNCKECGEFFQPSPEEEKLFTTGGLPVLCPDCERKRWEAKKPPEDKIPVYPGVRYVGDGRELCRAARFNSDGIETFFIALPLEPYKAVAATLRKPRKHDVGVFVFSERQNQLHTIPRTQLHTNIDTYIKQRKPLRIMKIPSYWDPFTGIGEIEIARKDIVRTEIKDRQVRVELKDGGCLILYYR